MPNETNTVDRKAREGQSTLHKAITALETQVEELMEVATAAYERGDRDEAENVNYAIGKMDEAQEALRLCI